MAIKQMEVVVCDFKHKHDRPAVNRIEVDVCAQHELMFADRQPDPQMCDECGRTFKTESGLNHHMTVKHPNVKRKAVRAV